VLASALFRPATVLTAATAPAGGSDGGDGGDGGGQVETLPKTPVRVVAQEQTVSPLALTLGPSVAEL